MTAEVSEYKGHQILSLSTGGGKPFSFGVKKAQSILEHLEDIKAFVADNEGGGTVPQEKTPF